ncbi:MAG: hypothetical protein ACFFDT_35120 [Candidatus Hodarchaeota archaeon]
MKTSSRTKSLFTKESQPPAKPAFSSYDQGSSPSSYTSSYRPSHRSSSQWGRWLFIGFFIIVIVGFAAVILLGFIFLPFSFNIFNNYEYIGDNIFFLDDNLANTSSSVELEIHNSVGSVDIEIIDTPELFEAHILTFAREGHDMQEANTFEVDEHDNNYFIFFDSSSGSGWENPYYYDLEIIISNQVTTALNIEVSTGSISVNAQQTNLSSLFLDTSTGSITADFQEVFFSTATSKDFTLHTSTGSITATFDNLLYASSEIEWMIETSTGSIDFDLFQETINDNTLINYNVDTSTGSINFNYVLNSTIGLQVYADVSTGNIYTPGYSTDEEYTYKSENYDSASMKIYVLLGTSTGSINILD